MEPTKEHAGPSEQAERKIGGEQQEPGAPTRQLNDETTQGSSDVEQIARQQGTSQRGYTADGPQNDRAAQFDPEHPGGRPEGDPRR
ncbi:hypothetical protein WMF18_06545 [Sorangium sp. So ce315]|uniref:hypothetical protein n=1 Tax=Sorangium sp. So ce315 TaxID=3133299 RepID=UPI003F6189E4